MTALALPPLDEPQAAAEGTAMPLAAPMPELSRPIVLDELVEGEPLTLAIEATPEQRAALGRRLGLVALGSLMADIRAAVGAAGRVRVDIDYRADVVQSCVVTLEPVTATVGERISQEFVRAAPPPDGATGADAEVSIDPEEGAERLKGGQLDAGELLTQYLALALDPYPRKEGASFTGFDTDRGDLNPAFAALGEIASAAAKRR